MINHRRKNRGLPWRKSKRCAKERAFGNDDSVDGWGELRGGG